MIPMERRPLARCNSLGRSDMKKLLGAAAILACIIGPAGAVPASVSGTPVAVEFAPDLTVDEIAIVVKKGWLNRRMSL